MTNYIVEKNTVNEYIVNEYIVEENTVEENTTDDENLEETTEEIQEELTEEIQEELTDKEIVDDLENFYDVKDIIVRINRLNGKEKLHILNILKQYDHQYTKNSNGYFFNLTHIDDDVLYKLSKCIELIEKNRDLIKEMDKKRDELLEYYKSLIEEKLLNTIKEKTNKYIEKITLTSDYTNVFLDFNRIIKIKRKNLHKKDIDPDILIKQHNKMLNKFPKDSVFHRISSKMRFIRGGKVNHYKEENSNETYEYYNTEIENDNYEGDDNYDVDDIEQFEELDEIEPLDEVEPLDKTEISDELNENDDLNENEDLIDNLNEDPDDIDDLVDDDVDKISNSELSEEDTQDKNLNEMDKTLQDIMYYKKLLGEQGFKFNENSRCVLVYQQYIV